MDSPENEFRQLAIHTQSWLKFGDIHGITPGEESITDWQLVRLVNAAAVKLQTCRFTKSNENKNGADFHLHYFRSGAPTDGGIGLLVQAKRLYPDATFRAFKYSNKDTDQIYKLIQTAETKGWTPIYALYQPSLRVGNSRLSVSLSSDCDLITSKPGPSMAAALGLDPFPGRETCDLSKLGRRDEGDLGIAIALAKPLKRRLEGLYETKQTATIHPTQKQIGDCSVPLACLAHCYCRHSETPPEMDLLASIRATLEWMPGGEPVETNEQSLAAAIDEIFPSSGSRANETEPWEEIERPAGIPNEVGRLTVISANPA